MGIQMCYYSLLEEMVYEGFLAQFRDVSLSEAVKTTDGWALLMLIFLNKALVAFLASAYMVSAFQSVVPKRLVKACSSVV